MAMKTSVIVAGTWTPIGRLNNALKGLRATDSGGMESMTNAPYLLMNSRVGITLGDTTLKIQ